MTTNTTDRTKKHLVEPETLRGFQDLLPEKMIARNWMVERIRNVYEKYGFVPLDTPILEHLSTLLGTGGEEANKNLFRLESPERRPIAMRFDLTVGFARLLAQYPDQLKLPFRRYQIGPVFRADDPASGRFRQFVQFDIDAAGSESLAVDAEIVAAMAEALQALELASHEFKIFFNNRKLVDAMLIGCGITDGEVQKHVMRVLDKLAKVGEESVREELGGGRVDESGDPIKGVGLPGDTVEKILAFVSVKGTSRTSTLEALARLLPDSELTKNVVREMSEFNEALAAFGFQEAGAIFDPSVTRGLEYYTGPVFEAHLTAAPQFGAVMGGGRYDHLVDRFKDEGIPATGASIGLDRLMSALAYIGKIPSTATTTKVLVLSFRSTPTSELLKAAVELRAAGIATEIFFGDSKTGFKDQLSIANARQIRIAVILGEDELKAGTVSIKDLHAGMEARSGIQDREEFRKAGKAGQQTVPRNDLVKTVSAML